MAFTDYLCWELNFTIWRINKTYLAAVGDILIWRWSDFCSCQIRRAFSSQMIALSSCVIIQLQLIFFFFIFFIFFIDGFSGHIFRDWILWLLCSKGRCILVLLIITGLIKLLFNQICYTKHYLWRIFLRAVYTYHSRNELSARNFEKSLKEEREPLMQFYFYSRKIKAPSRVHKHMENIRMSYSTASWNLYLHLAVRGRKYGNYH